MYRKAVITDEISQDLAVAVDIAREYCLDALEIRSVNNRNPFQMTKDDIRHIKKVADDNGLGICCVSSPLFKISLEDEAAILDHIESFRRIMDTMDSWNTRLIRGFDFLYTEVPSKRNRIAGYFEKIIPIAEDAGVTIVLESEPAVNSSDIDTLTGFLDYLDSSVVRGLFDPGNEVLKGRFPPYPYGYEKLRPYISHIHIKDMTKEGPALLGAGDVDYTGLFKALKDEYDGFVSVETHFRFSDVDDGRDYLHPEGQSFSEGGEEATIASLNVLDGVYRW